jgi:hypothetical protein
VTTGATIHINFLKNIETHHTLMGLLIYYERASTMCLAGTET